MNFEADWIDLSLPLGPNTPIYPGDPPLELTTVASLDDAPYHLSRLVMGSHTGTHLDAPAHFIRGGRTLGEIPLARLNGPALVLHLAAAGAIEPADLAAAWPAGAAFERVLLRTPNSEAWALAGAGVNAQPLSLAAADWLLARGVTLVGVDALSLEAHASHTFPVHHRLLGADVIVLEGLDLRHVAAGAYELLCLPLRLESPDGGPVRALVRPLR